jgi:hypothetical protein
MPQYARRMREGYAIARPQQVACVLREFIFSPEGQQTIDKLEAMVGPDAVDALRESADPYNPKGLDIYVDHSVLVSLFHKSALRPFRAAIMQKPTALFPPARDLLLLGWAAYICQHPIKREVRDCAGIIANKASTVNVAKANEQHAARLAAAKAAMQPAPEAKEESAQKNVSRGWSFKSRDKERSRRRQAWLKRQLRLAKEQQAAATIEELRDILKDTPDLVAAKETQITEQAAKIEQLVKGRAEMLEKVEQMAKQITQLENKLAEEAEQAKVREKQLTDPLEEIVAELKIELAGAKAQLEVAVKKETQLEEKVARLEEERAEERDIAKGRVGPQTKSLSKISFGQMFRKTSKRDKDPYHLSLEGGPSTNMSSINRSMASSTQSLFNRGSS